MDWIIQLGWHERRGMFGLFVSTNLGVWVLVSGGSFPYGFELCSRRGYGTKSNTAAGEGIDPERFLHHLSF